MTEQQIIDHLTKLSKGDINDKSYRKTLIRLFVNKIFLYDDRYTITFNTGDEEVTITDKLLSEIEDNFNGDTFCISNLRAHHTNIQQNPHEYFFHGGFACFRNIN